MPLSPEKVTRCQEAVDALRALREEYSDVLVVLDYVAISDISNYQPDSTDSTAGDVLSESEISAVLWHAGKHTGNTSEEILASLVEFALDDHERRNTQ